MQGEEQIFTHECFRLSEVLYTFYMYNGIDTSVQTKKKIINRVDLYFLICNLRLLDLRESSVKLYISEQSQEILDLISLVNTCM